VAKKKMCVLGHFKNWSIWAFNLVGDLPQHSIGGFFLLVFKMPKHFVKIFGQAIGHFKNQER
jgi:hypothetical protein